MAAFLAGAQDDGGGPGGPGGPGDMGGPGGPGDMGGGPGGPGGPGGNFDPAQFQQRMLDQTRETLNITNDEEWSAIEPLIQKVMDARRAAAQAGGMGMRGFGGRGGPGGAGAQSDAELESLQKLLTDQAPTPQVNAALTKYRAAHKEKQAKLEAAQAALKSVLSIRQEAQAVVMGLLP
jgi:hypothetical protein